jgi:NADPH:quinone reductase-like Zn-dependent oxidoreductase
MIKPIASMVSAMVHSIFVSQKQVSIFAKMNQPDLLAINELLVSGKVTPVIDRTCALHEVPDAIRYLEQGHARGKVIMSLPA